jgi:hypothetical protein
MRREGEERGGGERRLRTGEWRRDERGRTGYRGGIEGEAEGGE